MLRQKDIYMEDDIYINTMDALTNAFISYQTSYILTTKFIVIMMSWQEICLLHWDWVRGSSRRWRGGTALIGCNVPNLSQLVISQNSRPKFSILIK